MLGQYQPNRLWYIRLGVSIGAVRLEVVFYRSNSGARPVRLWLKSLPVSHKKAIGEDIKTIQFGWPIGMLLVEKLSSYL
jgi:hypothetical protein